MARLLVAARPGRPAETAGPPGLHRFEICNLEFAIFNFLFDEKRHAVGPRVGGAEKPAGLWLNRDGVDESHAAVAIGDPLDRVLLTDFVTDELGNPGLAENRV